MDIADLVRRVDAGKHRRRLDLLSVWSESKDKGRWLRYDWPA